MLVRLLSLEELDDHEIGSWRALAGSAAEPNPFLEPDFALPAAAHLRPRAVRLLVVGEEQGWEAPETQQLLLESDGHRNIDWEPVDPETFALSPGEGVYVPVHGPHWVKKGATVSVSPVDHLPHAGHRACGQGARVQPSDALVEALAATSRRARRH